MMKRFFVFCLSFILLVPVLGLHATANDKAYQQSTAATVEYFDDGSYIVITIAEQETALFAATTKSGSKFVNYYNSDNEKVWTVTVYGSFSYTGTSSSCTASSVSYTIYNDSWKVKSATASRSANKAIGDFTCKFYLLGIPVKTVEQSVTLSCSSTGVLS